MIRRPRAKATTGRPRITWVLEATAVGGAEAYVLRLIDGLDVEASVVSLGELPAGLAASLRERPQVSVTEVRAVRGKFDVAGIARLTRAVVRTRPDLVHVNANAPGNAGYGIVAAWLGRRPAVLTVHTEGAVASSLQRHTERWLLRRCCAVIAVSSPIAALLVAMGAPAERVHVVRNGVPRARAARGPAGSTLVIGFLGRLTPQKGVDILIEALRRCLDRGRDMSLLVGGTGPELPRLRRQAEGLPVAFVGHVSDVADWWGRIHVACLPSRHEGLPFVLLEAMAAGVPVVATDVGDVAAAVGATASIVPPADVEALAVALEQMTDPDRRRASGEASRTRATEALSLEQMLIRTAEVYGRCRRGDPVQVRLLHEAAPPRRARRENPARPDRPGHPAPPCRRGSLDRPESGATPPC